MDSKTRKRTGTPGLLAFGCGAPLLLYAISYLYLRLTHELINYGHFIGSPGSRGPRGFSTTDIVYWPLIVLEALLRGL